ncbi:MAG: nucleotidyltransferase domain-containing protein [archaeon GB-1845-036]|nr:nucleotidyltransferase domain-containing protein [Candidatus Culexmicrobium thermophilum]HDO21214.1 nucleotidyltransferase domain-containing protein [Candidatus Bathyarchaeota archaeon]
MSIKYDLKKLEYLKNYMAVAEKVKNIIVKFDPNAEVYVFGSTVEGKITGASDIDILVISEKENIKYKIKVEVAKKIDAPIQIHFTTRKHYERWYKRFINKKVKI